MREASWSLDCCQVTVHIADVSQHSTIDRNLKSRSSFDRVSPLTQTCLTFPLFVSVAPQNGC